MSDDLKALSDKFRQKQMAAATPPPTTNTPIIDLTDSYDQRLEEARKAATAGPPVTTDAAPVQKPAPKPKVTPPKPSTQATKRAGGGDPTRGTFSLNMPIDLDEAINDHAERNDLWTVEYIREAIKTYGPKISASTDGARRRRSRTATRNPSRTYHLGEQAKNELQTAAKRTHRSQSAALVEILKKATSDNFEPTVDNQTA